MIRPVPGLQIEDQPDKVVGCMCVWAEARGQSAKGRLAVRWVITTRAHLQKTSVRQIVLAKRQFSSFNADDPNRAKLLTAWLNDSTSWAQASETCELFEAMCTIDPTNGATHYYNPKVAQPAWGRGHKDWEEHVVIEAHVFGRAA